MQPVILRDSPNWPLIVEMNIGAGFTVRRRIAGAMVERELQLLEIEEFWEPDYWIENNPEHRTFAAAKITVNVDGETGTVWSRAYQSPALVNGLYLYVEATRTSSGGSSPVTGFNSDVRFSVCMEGESWGPQDTLFPLRDYRWRSSNYNNTWIGLVPYNKHYYHRAEDWGAIPDKLPVISTWPGKVVLSPLPEGDQRSNALAIQDESGTQVRYAHMNLDSIDPSLQIGSSVQAGQQLGLTGMTWLGTRRQHNDPHLHVAFYINETTRISPFPFLTQAYFRMYSDPLLPIAGGYLFTTAGCEVELDGSRSLARPGRKIVSHEWRLQDGRKVSGPLAKVRYDRPGLYSEELVVTADDGAEDRDFAQVRVYDPSQGRNVSFGWIYHTPVRSITPGNPVLFWKRLVRPQGEVTIDFGDGSKPEAMTGIKEIAHAYSTPGCYTVCLQAQDIRVRVRVVVEEGHVSPRLRASA